VPDSIEIKPSGRILGTIRPPGSKSITNRALVCAALADGQSILTGALDSEDTQVMIDSLSKLGIGVDHDRAAQTLRVSGCGGKLPVRQADLYVGNSGTTVRFLTALVTLGDGAFRLDGIPRMRERPIQDLLDALGQLGADARSELRNGCPPVIVHAKGLPGGRAQIAGNISSQFLSGLLMAAPCALGPVDLRVVGELVSQPYVRITLAVMQAFGVAVETSDLNRFYTRGRLRYRKCAYAIEPDASAASYFFAAAAITGGEVTVEGLSAASVQGDVAFCDCLKQMGCEVDYRPGAITVRGQPLRGNLSLNMNAISDTVQTLAAVALFADGPVDITGIGHIRHKETDRIHALATELRKLGADVDERPDGLRIIPVARQRLHGAEVATYNDHRMAMSMALVGLAVPRVVILDPDCTKKTYPGYFGDLERLCGR
jgi:3-phosphoshikimate 1-carboxyvinyltransferase